MHFDRKKDRHGVARYVVVYVARNEPLPRALTKHLDGQPDHNIEFWMADYAARVGAAPPRTVLQHPVLRRMLEDHIGWLEAEGSHRKTVAQHRRMLEAHVLPALVRLDEAATDPNVWPRLAPRLRDALADAGCSDNTIRVANVALRGLWEWLARQQQVLNVGLTLLLLNPTKGRRRTPLDRVVMPEEVLAFGASAAPSTVRLMALVAYFFSLRPQELFALERRHFRAGRRAADLEAVRVMREAGLGRQLAYFVEKQRDERGVASPPKELSVGWVCCFDDRAAALLVPLLADRPTDGFLLPPTGDSQYYTWRHHGMKGLTLKDLRRASAYWLGHYSGLQQSAVQSHLRHSDAESTAWYMRRPGEESEGDLDDLVLDAPADDDRSA